MAIIPPRCAPFALAMLLALLVSRPAPAADAPRAHITTHYDLTVETLDPVEVGSMLEQFHAHLTAFFGAAPSGRLAVGVYATRERFHAALAKDDQPKVDAGGYYAPDTRKAYLYVQPSEYYTRQLLLHEATHQFHYLAATENRRPKLGLYIEGLAEYFGMHDWDGRTLRTGVVPAISLEDYPAKALERFGKILERDFEGMVLGRKKCERPESWATMHFLAASRPKEFRAWARALDRQVEPAAAWAEAFGPVKPADLAEAFEAHVRASAQPWKIVSIAWQQRGAAIEGNTHDQAVGVALLKEMPARLSVRLEPATKAWSGGLVFNHLSRESYALLHLTSDRQARIIHRENGKWRSGKSVTIPAGKDGDTLALARDDKGVHLSVNGRALGTFAANGQVRLHIQEGRIAFRREAETETETGPAQSR